MAFGFHLVIITNRSADEIVLRVDEIAGALAFSSQDKTQYGFQQRSYRQSQSPELKVAFDCQAERCQMSMYPLEEREVVAYGEELLVKFWSNAGVDLDGELGRTFHEVGYGVIDASEIEGQLKFVDWYQYFSPRIVERWGFDRLRNGPFYRVDEYSNGACGIWLAKSPFDRLGRTKAAEYLGVTLPKRYWRHVQTGEPVEMPWD